MRSTAPRSHVAALLVGLQADSAAELSSLSKLTALLQRTIPHVDPTTIVAQLTSTDGGISVTAAEDDAVPDALADLRVFRRESPVASANLAMAVPAWARGAAIAETVGPIRSSDGRQFWFDFYRIVRLVPVHFAGDPRPAFLFRLHQRPFTLTERIDAGALLEFFRDRTYRLERGSVWIRADLFATGAPNGSYIGLAVRGGTLTFAPPIIVADGKLTIPAGGSANVQLDLAAPVPPASGGGATGRDAADALLALPTSFAFSLSAGRGSVSQLADASWELYGQSIGFTRRANAAPTWEPAINSVLIPYTASAGSFGLRTVRSPFATPAGTAPIERAGWALAAAMIDITKPIEAAGIGGVAVLARSGIEIGWRGLRDGPLALPSPWILLAPGMLVLVDAAAVSMQATQRLRFWQESSPPGRSRIELRFGTPAQLIYLVAAGGTEAVFTRADGDAQLDRPVDVRATPFAIHTLHSQFALTYTDVLRRVFLFDDDILADALSPAANVVTRRGEVRAVAIRNALFTVTPVNSLQLVGTLRDDEMLERAVLTLGMGLYTLLPTLPDPYAANVAQLRRTDFRLRASGAHPAQLLVASVAWDKAATDDMADSVRTEFAFAPIGAQAQSIAAWDAAGANSARAAALAAVGQMDATRTSLADSVAQEAAAAQATVFSRGPLVSQIWDDLFARFGEEQFSLLDVSSNADQMGVSFAFFDARRDNAQGSPFDDVFADGMAPPINPLEVHDLDLSAQGRFVRAFTVPQISWDPIINLTAQHVAGDPPQDFLLFADDGGPTRILSDDLTVVPIAPIPVTHQIVADFVNRKATATAALFTLPFGLRAFAEFTHGSRRRPMRPGASLALNQPRFEEGALVGGLQLRADAPPRLGESASFRGCTAQMDNLRDRNGFPTLTGTLGPSVGTIFNNEFFLGTGPRIRNRGVPLERVDFSGYGASIFSHWEAPNASIASTSQARFDVFVGRTAHEVIQVRSLLYPWGIHVVRTITLFRASTGYTYRWDTGWQPESDGLFDFSYHVMLPGKKDPERRVSPYAQLFHPGVVRGVFNVRNIVETDAIKPFTGSFNKNPGDPYIDAENLERHVDGTTLPADRFPGFELRAVYFDGDFELQDVVAGATNKRVPSKGILGFVQLSPRGEPLTATLFRDLLRSQLGSIGGPLSCELNIAGSGQHIRVSRVDVSESVDASGTNPNFVVAARGAVVLPRGGAWSVVRHDQGTGEVSPLDPNATVPLIRRGLITDVASGATDAGIGDLFRLANPIDLVRVATNDTHNFGLLQTTGTQKALFRLPSFQTGLDQLLGVAPDFADSYRLIKTKGIFPNVKDAVPLVLGAFRTHIIEDGFRLLDTAKPDAVLQNALPPGPIRLIWESYLKIYVEYVFAKNETNKTGERKGSLDFGLDSAAAEGKQWLSKVNDIAMVVDLGPVKRLVTIKGSFDAKHGEAAGFRAPEMVFAPELQPVVDILTVLTALQGGDYAKAMQKGLDVAMSNSADSWNYAFHARKEIPVVQFPPGELYYAPQTPMKLQAHLALGVYFNESLTPTTDVKQLIPTAGAYIEFGGSVSVMCFSLGGASIYAIGTVDLRISGDTKAGPGLLMKYGFGCEIAVGLPVVANVSVTYMVGIEVGIDLTHVTVSAFLLFRGRAELLGGLVTITIQIEARGTYERVFSLPAVTNMSAQVTFAIDVTILFVINLHVSRSWQEQRQIA